MDWLAWQQQTEVNTTFGLQGVNHTQNITSFDDKNMEKYFDWILNWRQELTLLNEMQDLALGKSEGVAPGGLKLFPPNASGSIAKADKKTIIYYSNCNSCFTPYSL